jgi:hypothetical protein
MRSTTAELLPCVYVCAQVAAAVARSAWECGVSQLEEAPADWGRHCAQRAWWPEGLEARAAE